MSSKLSHFIKWKGAWKECSLPHFSKHLPISDKNMWLFIPYWTLSIHLSPFRTKLKIFLPFLRQNFQNTQVCSLHQGVPNVENPQPSVIAILITSHTLLLAATAPVVMHGSKERDSWYLTSYISTPCPFVRWSCFISCHLRKTCFLFDPHCSNCLAKTSINTNNSPWFKKGVFESLMPMG